MFTLAVWILMDANNLVKLTLRSNETINNKFGAVVQLGARNTGSVEVTGSNPVGSTISFINKKIVDPKLM